MKPLRLLTFIEAQTLTGPAKNLLQFARRLRTSYPQPPIDIAIATFDRGGTSRVFLDQVREAGIPLHTIPERGRFDSAVLAEMAKLIREVSPDIVQTHAVKSHFLVRWGGFHRLATWVAFHHGYTWPDLRMRLYNQLDWWSLRAAARVLTVNQLFRDELVRKGVSSQRIEVHHNSINPDWGVAGRMPEAAQALRARLGIDSARKIILIVGRLSDEKDHMTLFRALRRLISGAGKAVFSPHLLVVGDGPNRKSLEAAADSLELRSRVTFTGQVATAEPYYGIADLCVLSSLSEGSPNALLEAMAAKVPVVSTRVGGVEEIVTHQESALLVRARDEAGMTEAMERLLTQSEEGARLAARAYALVLERYTPDQYMQRLIQFYERASPRTAG